MRQMIGFYHAPKRGKHKNERAVALYPETAFTVVQKSLGLRESKAKAKQSKAKQSKAK